MRFCLAILFSFFIFASNAYAFSGFMSFGYGSGGSDLNKLTGGQNYDIQAGDGIFISGGVILPLSPTIPHRFEAQLGIGYMFQNDADDKDKNTVSWSHIPIDLIYFYRNTRELFRLGYGVTYQFSNKLDADGTNGTASTDVDNALGWVITAEKYFTSNDVSIWGIGLRYNMIDYSSSGFSKEANGDALFVTFTLMAAK